MFHHLHNHKNFPLILVLFHHNIYNHHHHPTQYYNYFCEWFSHYYLLKLFLLIYHLIYTSHIFHQLGKFYFVLQSLVIDHWLKLRNSRWVIPKNNFEIEWQIVQIAFSFFIINNFYYFFTKINFLLNIYFLINISILSFLNI